MTPAADTGRTASTPLARSIEEMKAELAAARQEAAQLRSRLLQAEKGGEISGRDPDGSGSQASPEAPSDLRRPGFDPSRAQWQPIETAPQDGTWVWGEWPEIDRGSYWRKAPRIVAPMRWMSPDNVHVEHWCIGGKLTVGDNPVRWAPILPAPPALGIEAEGQDAKRLDALHESPARRAMPDPLNPSQEAGDHEPR